MVVVAHHRSIIGNCLYSLIALMYKVQSSIFLLYSLYPTAETNFLGKLRTTNLEGVSVL